MKFSGVKFLLLVIICLPIIFGSAYLNAQNRPGISPARVLLISIDGFHALDLANFIQSHPTSTLAQLSSSGVTYTQATTSKPSNSFPGLLALVTGGSPLSTGVWYEGAYARTLSPPGSNCKTVGTEVVWSNALDKNKKLIDAGGGIDPAKLPLDPEKGCTAVYPHSFLRVNTIFEAVRGAGMRTAWIDKHPSYEMLNGPSGKGIDDLYTPEIGSSVRTVKGQEDYDDVKVEGLLNEISGQDHTGKNAVGVPALFGMSFQAFRYTQVIPTGGYVDASGTPSGPALDAMEHFDQSLGKLVSALKSHNLLDSTLIIVSAKHGQAPIDPSKHRNIDETIIPNMVNHMQSGLVALSYSDGNLTSIWLTDQSQARKVAELLTQPANQSAAGIQKVLWGESLKLVTHDPLKDNRIPDIVVIPNVGDIYSEAGDTGIAAHGGFSDDDTHVILLISNPVLKPRTVRTPVQTAQVAPTILQVLGIKPATLQSVQQEGTLVLPDLFAGQSNSPRMLLAGK